jgi:hypothetical protein
MNDVERITKTTFWKAFPKENIEKGFKVTRIYAFNEISIGDDEFLPAYVTVIFFGFVFYSTLFLRNQRTFSVANITNIQQQ